MPRLPVVSGEEVVRALETIGFEQLRQRGSHVSMALRGEHAVVVTVPLHKEMARGTLRAIIRHAGLTVEEFARALRS